MSADNFKKRLESIDWSKRADDDLKTAAWHEAGHFIIVLHYNWKGGAFVKRIGDASRENRAWVGQCHYDPDDVSNTVHFRRCVMAWGGPIADAIEADPTETADCFFDYAITTEGDEFSETDWAGMTAHPAKWRACKTAFGILLRRRAQFERVVQLLIEKHEVFPRDFWKNQKPYSSFFGQSKENA